MNRSEKFLDCAVEKAAGEERAYWFVISDESRDRDGDVVVQSTMKMTNYRKNPQVLFAHRYDTLPVGKGIEWKTDGSKTRMKIQFIPAGIDETADKVEKLVDLGYLKTVSIGFMVLKSEELTEDDKKGRPEMSYGRRLHAELLEVSIVPIPSNANALRERAFGELCAKAFSPSEEKQSDLLPYAGEDGAVNPRLLKASFAALFGARGGVPVPEGERKAAFNHLAKVAREAGLEVPEFREYTEAELRSANEDVWMEELLDITNAAMDADTKALASSYLVKGGRRAEIQATVDSLSKLLAATEIEPEAEPEEAEEESGLAEALKGLSGVVSKIA